MNLRDLLDEDRKIQLAPDQIAALRTILKLRTDKLAHEIVGWISASVHGAEIHEHVRQATPDIKTARARARHILRHASALKEAFEADPVSEIYFRGGYDFELGGSTAFKRYRLGSAQQTLFTEILSEIIDRASLLIDNEQKLRVNYLLPPKETNNQKNITLHLWPTLFVIFDKFRGRITYSPGGPLERFVCLVHEAAELPPPASATLKLAVNRWKLDKAHECEL